MPKRGSIWQVVQERAGFRGGARILEFVMLWAIYEAETGAPPSNVEEFVGWWGDDSYSLATAYRRLAEFRECFEAEGFETPSELFEAVGVIPGEFSVGTLRKERLA